MTKGRDDSKPVRYWSMCGFNVNIAHDDVMAGPVESRRFLKIGTRDMSYRVVISIALLLFSWGAVAQSPAVSNGISYTRDIQPIFTENVWPATLATTPPVSSTWAVAKVRHAAPAKSRSMTVIAVRPPRRPGCFMTPSASVPGSKGLLFSARRPGQSGRADGADARVGP